MSSLEDLVLEALPSPMEPAKPPFRPLPPSEIGSQRASFEDLLAMCQDFRAGASAEPRRAPYLLAQLVIYLENRPPAPHMFFGSRSVSRLFAVALEYAGGTSQELPEEIEEWLQAVERRLEGNIIQSEEAAFFWDALTSIDYLRDFFADDLEEELQFVSGTTKATVRRWISGVGNPAWHNRRRIMLLARIVFAARRNTEMTDAEILDWYRAPDGVRSMVCGYAHFLSQDLREALSEIDFRVGDF